MAPKVRWYSVSPHHFNRKKLFILFSFVIFVLQNISVGQRSQDRNQVRIGIAEEDCQPDPASGAFRQHPGPQILQDPIHSRSQGPSSQSDGQQQPEWREQFGCYKSTSEIFLGFQAEKNFNASSQHTLHGQVC